MIDERIGWRVKECRERLGLSQEQLAEKMGVTVNYISTIERGKSFPRCERLILLLNALETNADSIFYDAVKHSSDIRISELAQKMSGLSEKGQKRILDLLDFAIKQELDNQ